MKKWLSILGTIELTATSTTTLISCKKPNNNEKKGGNKPTPEPQQPPENSSWKKVYSNDNVFNKIDNKYYIVIWFYIFDNEWRINKFNNNSININIVNDLLKKENNDLQVWRGIGWSDWKNNPDHFKAVYRWNKNNEPQIPEINKDTGLIIDWKK
ncbi:lipoprotein [Spiroplasma endosymbiont of Phyllotreta cruciferae]|uniref:lipoprotein n=1 Tax=Spiroplasma endosymbiont of Phyllotreta cruciferae TaxID=2886375 RepID=UPI0020A0B81F|nr:lipoprotein [Spiroplasma endosymbiont of Phyllotreta cruciferae]